MIKAYQLYPAGALGRSLLCTWRQHEAGGRSQEDPPSQDPRPRARRELCSNQQSPSQRSNVNKNQINLRPRLLVGRKNPTANPVMFVPQLLTLPSLIIRF